MGTNAPTKEHVNQAMNDAIAESKPLATAADVAKQFQSKDNLHYIKSDDVVANPGVLLGSVFYEQDAKTDLMPFYIGVDGKVDESTVLKTPLVRSEMVVDKKIGASTDILSYVSLKLEDNEVFEFRILDNYAARLSIKGKDWNNAINDWLAQQAVKSLLADKSVGSVGVVVGIVQKYISTKKYRKFDGSAKGGAFGVNANGELYTSSTDYSLDIVYGLNLIYMPRVTASVQIAKMVNEDSLVVAPDKVVELNTRLSGTIKNIGLAKFERPS